MIRGLDVFRDSFQGYEDEYILIGGAACDIISSDQGFDFRATKDFDMVLIVEALTKGFAENFWEFINSGGYTIKSRLNGSPVLYRFQKPENQRYPHMIELFSKRSDLLVNGDQHIGPIQLEEDVSCLSAIMLDDAYYHLLTEGREIIDGIPVLKTEYIIVFKCKAYQDMVMKKNRGEETSDREIKKHRNDVVRLFTTLPGNLTIQINEDILSDIKWFIEEISEEDIDLYGLGIRERSIGDWIRDFRRTYGLDG